MVHITSSLVLNKNIIFGQYLDDPIEWEIIDDQTYTTEDSVECKGGIGNATLFRFTKSFTKTEEITLISKYGLDTIPYNLKKKPSNLNFTTSHIFNWLNNEFYNSSFKDYEKEQIKEYSFGGYVALPNAQLIRDLFHSHKDRVCQPTNTAIKNGAFQGRNGNCWYWLCDNPSVFGKIPFVSSCGEIVYDGNSANKNTGCVRPVIILRI